MATGSVVAGSAGSGLGTSLPETLSLNSRMPRPSDLPTSGSRLGPRMTSAMIRTMASWMGETSGIGSFRVVERAGPLTGPARDAVVS